MGFAYGGINYEDMVFAAMEPRGKTRWKVADKASNEIETDRHLSSLLRCLNTRLRIRRSKATSFWGRKITARRQIRCST